MEQAIQRISWSGFCWACGQDTQFSADTEWYRDSLVCEHCDSVVRERALGLVLERERPNWRNLRIHESSPATRGISLRIARECRDYIPTHFYSDIPCGAIVNGFRSENLQSQTFGAAELDIVITLDVMEHVFEPEDVYKEVYRTLKPGGLYLHTFPIRKWLTEPTIRRASLAEDGSIKHLTEPEIHGNPINGGGSLVTFDYGYDIHQQIALWAPFSVEVARFNDRGLGLVGEYTDVVICRKHA